MAKGLNGSTALSAYDVNPPAELEELSAMISDEPERFSRVDGQIHELALRACKAIYDTCECCARISSPSDLSIFL